MVRGLLFEERLQEISPEVDRVAQGGDDRVWSQQLRLENGPVAVQSATGHVRPTQQQQESQQLAE